MSNFSVILLLTEKCNLRCGYCYERFELKASDSHQIDRIKSFFSVLADKYETINVSFFGGEPMLAVHRIRDVLAHNAKLNCRFTYSLTSNGTLLTLAMLQELIDANLVQFQITLDGWKKSHDLSRHTKKGGGTFDVIYENLLSYRNAVGNFTGIIRVNASPANSDDICQLAQNIVTDFEGYANFKTFIRPVGRWGGANDDHLAVLDRAAYKRIEDAFYRIVPDAMHFQVETDLCYAARPNQLLVYPDGTLGKCTVGLHDDLNKVGHIQDDGSLVIDSQKFSFWSRGLITGDAGQKACPYWAKA
jgi:uncharacterized protein